MSEILFAPGAHSNIATEELMTHMHAAGYDPGIDEPCRAEAVRLAREVVIRFPAIGSLDPGGR